jgi:hypothetical protein
MDKMEKAEKVVDKTGVSYEDARTALEQTDYDVLDAIVWLEQHGKTERRSASYSTEGETRYDSSIEMSHAQKDYEEATHRSEFSEKFEDGFGRFMSSLGAFFKRSVQITLVVSRKGERLFTVPLLLFVILLIVGFWIVVPLMLVALFFGVKYSFDGIRPVTVDLNDLSEKASRGAESLKQDLKSGVQAADPTTGTPEAGAGETPKGQPDQR